MRYACTYFLILWWECTSFELQTDHTHCDSWDSVEVMGQDALGLRQ